MRTHASGFSLLELMIVIAIIGILAVIALPSYQNYARRARFAEVISTAQTYKTSVAIALQQGVALKELKNGAHGIPASPTPTKNLRSVTVKNGVITGLGSDKTAGATFILTPDAESGAWAISGTCIAMGLCSD